MSEAIERRLAIVERKLNPRVPAIREIMIHGGLPGPDNPMAATSGARKWERAQEESFEVFRARAKAAAEAEGEAFVVFGGLPDDE